MAPGAKIAMYKVCWEAKPGFNPGCFNSDSVAAINQAVLDGVDVINYSIGGTSESDVLDSVEQAFRAASNAGVFVANSAGNSGPGASTLDHPSPWLTTVAAGTFRRAFQVVELGNGARYVGASTTPSAAHAGAARHGARRQGGFAPATRTPSSVLPARSTPPRRRARSCSATAASSTGSRRASRSSGSAVSAW